MSTVTTTKLVDLGQLSAEMGGKRLSMQTEGDTRTITCHDQTTTAALQAAVDAHVAIDTAANQATLRQRAETAIGANNTFLALASPTNAQTLAQVKLLTRECSAVIRLLLGKLDSTD